MEKYWIYAQLIILNSTEFHFSVGSAIYLRGVSIKNVHSLFYYNIPKKAEPVLNMYTLETRFFLSCFKICSSVAANFG